MNLVVGIITGVFMIVVGMMWLDNPHSRTSGIILDFFFDTEKPQREVNKHHPKIKRFGAFVGYATGWLLVVTGGLVILFSIALTLFS